MGTGGSPGTWETLPSPLLNGRNGETGIKAPSLWQVALDGHRSEQRVQGGTASRGQPKERGMDGRESERLVLPKKRGNRPGGTPWREGDAGSRTFRGDR